MTEYLADRVDQVRLLGDRILLEPMEWDASSIIIAIRHGRPVRGRVSAIGPGVYPKRYAKDRSRYTLRSRFRPTECQVGDVVELGGLNQFDGQGYQFTEVLVGTKIYVICQEADVCGVREAA